MDLSAIKAVASSMLMKSEDEFLLPSWNIIVSQASRGGVEFTARNNGWCVVPRWIIEASRDFCDMGGYADMTLGEYLAKLVEEYNE